MEIHLLDEGRRLEVWLTRADQADARTRRQVEALCRERGACAAAIFVSGREDLYQQTRALLLRSRDGAARRAAQARKEGEDPRIP